MARLRNIANVGHTTPLTLRMSSGSYLVIYLSNIDRGGNKFSMSCYHSSGDSLSACYVNTVETETVAGFTRTLELPLLVMSRVCCILSSLSQLRPERVSFLPRIQRKFWASLRHSQLPYLQVLARSLSVVRPQPWSERKIPQEGSAFSRRVQLI